MKSLVLPFLTQFAVHPGLETEVLRVLDLRPLTSTTGPSARGYRRTCRGVAVGERSCQSRTLTSLHTM